MTKNRFEKIETFYYRKFVSENIKIFSVFASICVAGLTMFAVNSSIRNFENQTELVAEFIRDSVVHGIYSNTHNLCEEVRSKASILDIAVAVQGVNEEVCSISELKNVANYTIEQNIYFDIAEKNLAAKLTLVFDIMPVLQYFIFVIIAALVLLFCVAFISKRRVKYLAASITEPIKKITASCKDYKVNRRLTALQSLSRQDSTIKIVELSNLSDVLIDLAKDMSDYQLAKVELAKSNAIAQTTQMLAHDVRKPFSMMEALIQLIGDIENPKEIKETMQENLPSVSHAIRSVNGMIQDVMEIGAESKMTSEPINSRQFVSQVLRHQLQFREDLEIDIRYDLPEDLALNIDNLKYPRVFSNIVGNAIEHMKGKGKIWFKATSPSSGMAEFTIGNSNTYIPPEDVAKLFEAFFTKDKQGGTGLGLAIAKKIVEAHGGTIWCTSDQEAGTEFVFTIPCAIAKAIEPVNLFDTAQGYFKTRPIQKIEQQPEVSKEALEAISHSSVTLAIADDEAIYIDSLRGQIKKLSPNIPIVAYSTGIGLVESLASGKHPSIIILDADFGSGNISGFESCKLLRHSGYKGIICIHSNRGRLEYQPLAIEAGADYFVPKPMSKADLVNVIESNLTRGEAPIVSKKILLFEDEAIFQRRWKSKAKPKEVIAVRSWEEFINVHPGFDWNQIDFVVMDLHLADGENGLEVAGKIKSVRPGIKIYLSSNADGVKDPDNLLAGFVGKDPVAALQVISKG